MVIYYGAHFIKFTGVQHSSILAALYSLRPAANFKHFRTFVGLHSGIIFGEADDYYWAINGGPNYAGPKSAHRKKNPKTCKQVFKTRI